MSKIAHHPHRFAALAGLFVIFLTFPLTMFIVFLSIQKNGTGARAAEIPSVPLIDKQDAVVISEKKLCSFVSANQTAVGIVGEDGGESVRVGNSTYFAFGDTNTTTTQMPNSVATTTDVDASDCFGMTSKSSGGVAVPMMPKLPTECTAWPLDMTNTVGSDIYFFYYSFSSTNCTQRLGMGLGKMDANTLATTRVNNFFWQPGDAVTPNFDIYGAAFTKVGTDLYIIWNGQDTSGKDLTMLSKVPVVSIENKAAYTYWDGAAFQSKPANLKPIWDQGGVPTHGMTIRLNSFLGKWTAIYNTGYSSIMAMRTADNITGPWSSETTIVNCLQYYALGTSSGTAFPCYGAKEHPWYERNNGQIIYASHSNSVLYQPFLHEITFGKAINQWIDASGNSIYKQDGQQVSNYTQEGTAFYASPNQLPNFNGIHDWVNGSEHIYAVSSPGGTFTDSGIAFYAPTAPQFSLAVITQWNKGTLHRYSALDLSSYGYTKGPIAFYAKVTAYRITDGKVFPQNGSFFQTGVKANNNWVSGGHIKDAVFSGLNSGTNYSIATNTPIGGNKFFGQNILADSSGNITSSGDLAYINVLNLGVFAQNQALDTTNDLFTYWVHHTNVVDNPPEIGHQLNPYSRAGNFKSFFLTGNVNGTYQGVTCKPDCSGVSVWSGAVNFCGNDVTLTPTGATLCSKLSNFTLSGFSANTQYDLYYCAPNCDDALVKIVYPRTSDASGVIKYSTTASMDTDGDGISDAVDNCVSVANFDQRNSDSGPPPPAGNIGLWGNGDLGRVAPYGDKTIPNGDRLGDACETDRDNDGLPDTAEAPLNCAAINPSKHPFDTVAANHPNPVGGDITFNDGNGPSWDTDNDGVPDGVECKVGTNPRVATGPGSADYVACQQYVQNSLGLASNADADGDGLRNSMEVCHYNTSPNYGDSDGDAKGDCVEALDLNGDGVVNGGDQLALNRYVAGYIYPATNQPYKGDWEFDFNGDAFVNGGDQLFMNRVLAGVIPCPDGGTIPPNL